MKTLRFSTNKTVEDIFLFIANHYGYNVAPIDKSEMCFVWKADNLNIAT